MEAKEQLIKGSVIAADQTVFPYPIDSFPPLANSEVNSPARTYCEAPFGRRPTATATRPRVSGVLPLALVLLLLFCSCFLG